MECASWHTAWHGSAIKNTTLSHSLGVFYPCSLCSAGFMFPGVTAFIAAAPIVPVTNGTETQIMKLHKLRPSELPIYEDDGHCGCSYNHTSIASLPIREKSALEKEIHKIILAVGDSMVMLKSSKDRVMDMLQVGKAHTLDTVEVLRDESNLLGRVAVISIGGLSGLLLGIRGRFFKKFFYGTIGASAVASVCYPDEAAQISKSAYTISKYYTIVGYNKVQEELNSRREVKPLPGQSPKPSSNAEKVGEQNKLPPDGLEKSVPANMKSSEVKPKGDYGQSNPEDRDLYTTRGK